MSVYECEKNLDILYMEIVWNHKDERLKCQKSLFF